jgi:DNA mismatch repair protein MutS
MAVSKTAASKTPVMQQHAEAKLAHPDAVLFFRLGDFYEMFGDDAVLCAQALELTLTSRNKGKPDEIPMAGVPYHAAHGYIGRLLALGHKVAICEQMADPKLTKGIVPRAVVRVITPGTATHDDHLEARANNWLAALEVTNAGVGLSMFDLSTGELGLGSVPTVATALGELARLRPREVLLGGTLPDAALAEAIAALRQTLPATLVSADPALQPADIEAALPDAGASRAHLDIARAAAARAVRFARACNPTSSVAPQRLVRWELSDTLAIDPTAQAHLELVASASGDARFTLLHAIDATCTAGGSRLMRRRLLAPLKDIAMIRRRLDMVELFVIHSALRERLRRELEQVTDLERLSTRVAVGEATPRDLGKLRDGLVAAQAAAWLLTDIEDPALRETLETSVPPDTLPELTATLARALVERPPAQPKEGAIFQPDYDRELCELASLCESGAQHMTELEAKLRAQVDIPTLKVRFTRVFGWYIEVGRSHVRRVPESWRRKQTVASGERYTLPELEELADRIEHAEDRHRARERELLAGLVELVNAAGGRLAALAAQLSAWDNAAALAEIALRHDYVRPDVDASDVLQIEDGRHPVVERWAAAGRFVPNDVELTIDGARLWVITGPNMAGKSTLLRQTALITILAQMGSYVPARRARIGLVDRVLSRVGASDNLARGESTFMVEMRETAEILASASERSLVILDEIGRGTSTFDGLAIAWAVAEHLARSVRCRTLFATHYHEMTALDADPHIVNYSVSAREIDGDIVFLHRLVRGPANQSYGVAVAKLAGLPSSVLARAGELLAAFEGEELKPHKRTRARRASEGQLKLFALGGDGVNPAAPNPAALNPAEGSVLERIRGVDVDRLSPLDALRLLADMKGQLGA